MNKKGFIEIVSIFLIAIVSSLIGFMIYKEVSFGTKQGIVIDKKYHSAWVSYSSSFVNGECVKYIDETHFNGLDRLKKAKKIGVIVGNDEKFKFPYHIKNEDIKSIVTKEQFENMNYKIGE